MQDLDLSDTVQAKSDQLNALDIVGIELVITITDVKKLDSKEQPIWVYYHGCNNRPWKPSLGMRRVLMAGWGKMKSDWIGKSVKLWCNPDVKWAGKKQGGIEILAMSHIKPSGITTVKRENRQSTVPYQVAFLDVSRPTYPQDKFDQALPAMVKAIAEKKMSIEQVVAKCQQTGDLTPEQLAALEQALPVNADDEEEV